MLLDPVNAVTSVRYYKKVAVQSTGRTIGYLLYLSLLFTVVSAAALRVKVDPFIDETFDWLAASAPTMTFSAGKLVSAAERPVTLRHPKVPEVAVAIDTDRVEPVTVQTLKDAQVMGYLTGTAFYMLDPQENLRVEDFSKAVARPYVINAATYKNAAAALKKALLPVVMVVAFLSFFIWKTAAALLFSLLGLALNTILEAGLSYAQLFNVAAYAQTLVIVLQCIFIFMPVGMPLGALVSLAATGTYLWLGIKVNAASGPAEA